MRPGINVAPRHTMAYWTPWAIGWRKLCMDFDAAAQTIRRALVPAFRDLTAIVNHYGQAFRDAGLMP